MVNYLKTLISQFDLPGGAVLGLYTLCILGLSFYCVIYGKDIPNGVVSCYEMTVLGFAASKGAVKIADTMQRRKEEKTSAEAAAKLPG